MKLYWTAAQCRPKDFRVEYVKICDTDKESPIKMEYFNILRAERQKYTLNSSIKVSKDIQEILYFKMSAIECSLSRGKCNDLLAKGTPDICNYINKPNSIWSNVVNTSKPPLRCPIKAGTYHVENSTFDLSLVSRIPIDPCTLMINLTIFDYFPVSNRKRRDLVCISVKVTVTQIKSRLSEVYQNRTGV
ncbi:uncharacterized protein LOC116337652 [Contarinia nasturtii]|uniref:uncharacterized protein LOC116337652 n=1 Tax=Contarinia nasturtii TaxID=265458 RepID=UPI0012D3D5E7|nr:uncharacterized protein LOC116337652 [Contarinia nasturtii]